uniref:protein Frey 1 n=1 Tax=Lonchura striata TaxID=40157 RepID=UPI00129340C6|nr:uncharacterized protein C11orf94 homolog [Lonchura striata domestica]
MLCCLLLLALLLGAALPQPVHQRGSYSVPEDFSAPLELPQKHFGLVDGTVLSSPLRAPFPCTHPPRWVVVPELSPAPAVPADYGIKPKQPSFRTQAAPERAAELRRARKSKRDGLDLLEYYEDGHL